MQKSIPSWVRLLIAVTISAVIYLHSDTRIDWADEGFLWYGVSQTLAGHIPGFHFQSYDPGRYWWCAIVLFFLGDSLMALRLATCLFQTVALFVGLTTLRRTLPSTPLLILAGITIASWMLVPFRFFDASLPIVSVWVLSRVLQKPDNNNLWLSGLWLGVVTFFGVNHALYFCFSLLLALTALLFQKKYPAFWMSGLIRLCLGVLCGFAPILVLFVFIPGYFLNYTQTIFRLWEMLVRGQVTYPFPIVWPWQLHWDAIAARFPSPQAALCEYLNLFFIGMGFMILLCFYGIGFFLSLRKNRSAQEAPGLFEASLFVGLPYLHAVFGRSDSIHLGEVFFPVYCGLLTLPLRLKVPWMRLYRAGVLTALTVVSFFAFGLSGPVAFKHLAPRSGLVHYSVDGDKIWVISTDALFMDKILKAIHQSAGPDGTILLAPRLAMFYRITGKVSPVQDIYMVIPQSERIQRKMIGQMERQNTGWALISNEETRPRLSESYPLFWEYLMTHFERTGYSELPPGYVLLKRRS